MWVALRQRSKNLWESTVKHAIGAGMVRLWDSWGSHCSVWVLTHLPPKWHQSHPDPPEVHFSRSRTSFWVWDLQGENVEEPPPRKEGLGRESCRHGLWSWWMLFMLQPAVTFRAQAWNSLVPGAEFSLQGVTFPARGANTWTPPSRQEVRGRIELCL